MSGLMPDVMTFEEMDSYLRKKVARFRDHPLWEDAVQEGRISIWNDLQEGVKEHPHMVFRGVLRARALMFNPTVHPTGHVAIHTAGAGTRKNARGEATREKIRNYVKEYRSIHGEEPTQYRIAKDLGMDKTTVRSQILKMKSGETGWHHPGLPLTKDGRVDLKALVFVELKFSGGEDRNDSDLGINEPIQEGFEDSFVGSALAQEAMSRLTEAQEDLIRALFYEDATIESYCQEKGFSLATGYRRRDSALIALRDFYTSTDLPMGDYL
jgi:hypothetical protein